VVIKSPGISAYRHEILEAQHNGTRFASGTALWFAENPQARVIAVTGTKGKSTVTALTAHLLRALGRRVALAGNIGMPLLELLDPPQAPDWWVVELSSFQTREAANVEGRGDQQPVRGTPRLARYARTLRRRQARARRGRAHRRHQRGAGFAARPRRDASAAGPIRRRGRLARGRRCTAPRRSRRVRPRPLAAARAAQCAEPVRRTRGMEAAGEDAIAAAPAIADFRPLPHRLQTLGERDGLCWVDDSIATTPQATAEALASLAGRPVTVLVGGYERGLDWGEFAEGVRERPPHAIVAMGANRARIEARLRDSGGAYRLESVASVDDAVRLARMLTPARRCRAAVARRAELRPVPRLRRARPPFRRAGRLRPGRDRRPSKGSASPERHAEERTLNRYLVLVMRKPAFEPVARAGAPGLPAGTARAGAAGAGRSVRRRPAAARTCCAAASLDDARADALRDPLHLHGSSTVIVHEWRAA
jgi:UDP-N-acetylmuramoylalanine--D-glutamate ligase